MKNKNFINQLFICLGCIILLLSFFPRFYDTLKFLPYFYRDEQTLVEYAVGFLRGDLHQKLYSYGPLTSYFLAIVYWVMSWFVPGTIEDFTQNVFFDNTIFYYTARVCNSLFSIATGFVVYKLIRLAFNKTSAFFALSLLFFPFLEIQSYFFSRTDTLLSLTYALSIFFITLSFNKPKLKYFILSAIFTGLSFSVKPLTSILIIPTIFIAFLFLHIKSIEKKEGLSKQVKNINFFLKILLKSIRNLFLDKRLYLFLIVASIIAFIFFPHAFINFVAEDGFLDQQISRMKHESKKNYLLPYYGWNLFYYFPHQGKPFVILSVIGLIYGLISIFIRKIFDYNRLIILSFPIVFLLFFSFRGAGYYWYSSVIYFIIIGIIIIFEDISKLINSDRLNFLFGFSLIIILLFMPAKRLIKNSIKMNSKTDYLDIHTAARAQKWIEKNIPNHSSIFFYGGYTRLPRLVANNINNHAQICESFKWYKFDKKYFIELFEYAYNNYSKNKSNPRYRLSSTLYYFDKNKHKQSIVLKYQRKFIHKHLKDLLLLNKMDYLITFYHIDDSWNKYLVKSFHSHGDLLIYGTSLNIYKINK